MRKVSFIFIVLGLFTLLLNVCSANEQSMDKKGKWGISLSVSGLSNLGIGLYQGGIGVKHWRSNSLVWKTILGFSIKNTIYPSYGPEYTDSKTKEGSFSLNLGAEFHFSQDSKFSPYFYTGLDISTHSTTYYYSVRVSTPGAIEKKHTTTNSFGLDGAIGLEYLFNKHLSLAAEYQVNLSYQIHNEEWTVVPGQTATFPLSRDFENFNFGAETSTLILTVYF